MERAGHRFIAMFMSLLLAVGLMPLTPSASFAEETGDESTASTAAQASLESNAESTAQADAEANAGIATQADAEELAIAITSALKDGDTELTLSISGNMTGKYVMVRTFDASATTFRPSYDPYGDDTVIYNKSHLTAGQVTASLTTALKKDQQVVAFIYDYDDDINIRKLAASSPVTVGAAGSTDPVEPTEVTRKDLLNGSYITLTTPNTSGVAAGKFLTTDRTATAAVTLHKNVPSATLSVVAWPRTLSFGSDMVDSDDINRFGKNLFSQRNVKNGDVIDIAFNDAVFSSLDDPTAYYIIAYLQFADTTNDDSWPIVKPTAGFEIVNASGKSFQDYVFPDATIDESELPVGATSMHISLTGDERLFQIARDSRNSSSNLQIHVTVVEYDASVTPETYDYEETDQVRLFSADVYEPFRGKEITFSQPLEEGKRVRALVYTTQYSGSLAPNPIPASHDYTANKPDDSVLVTKTAPPVVPNPTVEVTGTLTTDTTSFDVSVANPPENSMILVKAYGPDETIATQNGTFVASMSATAGTHTVTLQTPLSAGYRVVAFIMASGEIRAQSSPVTVTGEATNNDVVILGSVDKDDKTIRVQVNCDIPSGAHLSLRQFDEPVNTTWGSANSVGSVENPVRGENVVSVSKLRRNYVVAFLATDFGNTIYAASEPMAITHEAAMPTAVITPADVMFTEGDLFINLSWSVDKYAKNASYSIYQYEGDDFDANTTELIGSGNLINSISNSGIQNVSLSGLKAGCKVRVVVTADSLSAASNPLTVGAKPAWATETPSISFGQKAVRVSDSSVKVHSLYGEGYEELGSEYFCVVSVYQLEPEVVERGFTDEDLEGLPVSALYRNDTRNDQTRGELTMTFNTSAQLVEGNYLVLKLRLPDPIRQDNQAMWCDYISEAIPIVSDDTVIVPDDGDGDGKDDGGDGGSKKDDGSSDGEPGDGGSDNSGGNEEGNGTASGSNDQTDSGNNATGGSAQGNTQMPATGDRVPTGPVATVALLSALIAAGAFGRLRLAPRGKHVARR